MDCMVNDFQRAFVKKRILITGDTGFKGSWLSLWLHILGAEVMGFALPPEREKDHFNLLKLDSLIHHVDGDIREEKAISRIFQEFQPEVVFHLAAQPLVRLSYAEPKMTFDTNISGSVNLLEMVRQTSAVRALVFVTSDKCYANKEWVWGYRENDELGGLDPYSASKAAAEMVFGAYLNSFFKHRETLGAASVRAGNVIGGGDWSQDRIVPDTITSLMTQQPLVLRNPQATRPWQHVLEPLSGYLLTALKLLDQPKVYSGSWNFGPRQDSVRTVLELSKELIKNWGSGEIKIQQENTTMHEAGLLKLNCDKANQILKWIPRWDFEASVAHTVDWYKQISEGKDALDISQQQIKLYMEG